MDRDLLIVRSMKGPANSSESEDHGHLCKTGHCRPWEKIILSHFSAMSAGGCSLLPDSDFRLSRGRNLSGYQQPW